MDYKQKYKEALERAKKYKLKEDLIITQDIFPELKDSEDERIRKEIIEYLKGEKDAFPRESDDFQTWLAWLEKQGEPVEINPTEFDTRLQALIGKFDSLPKEELMGSLSFWMNVVQNDGTYKIEKQGEQEKLNAYIDKLASDTIYKDENGNPIDKDLMAFASKVAFSMIPATKTKSYHNWNRSRISDSVIKGALWQKKKMITENVEQKPADKNEPEDYSNIDPHYFKPADVEPKFKVGDWIIFNEHHNSVYQVEKIQGLRYYLRHYTGGSMSVHIDNQLIRNWNIKDAKDGDVLVDRYGNIGIFEKTFGFDWHSYCYLGCNGDFMYNDVGGSHDSIDTYPATKEQRVQLKKAMADAGYTFDFEKKELKKIEQRIISAEAKEAMYDKPAWSEEDETALGDALWCCKQAASIAKNENDMGNVWYAETWLKSLKDRVQPQPKQEWSEADNQYLCGLIGLIEQSKAEIPITLKGKAADNCIDWLKSLRPQNTWKPSEGAMKTKERR